MSSASHRWLIRAHETAARDRCRIATRKSRRGGVPAHAYVGRVTMVTDSPVGSARVGAARRGSGPRTEAVIVWSSDDRTATSAARVLRAAGFTTLRRAPAIAVGRLLIDAARHEVWLDDRLVQLSPTEFRLLAALAASPGVVHPPAELITTAWGPEYADSVEYVKPVISRLRRKLGDDARGGRMIETIRGFGYRLRGDLP